MTRPLEVVWLGRRAYLDALAVMEERAARRTAGEVSDALLLVEHPPTITLGRRGRRSDILLAEDELERRGVAVVETGRGGEVTYHGPGQLVGYPVLDLRPDRTDVRRYVQDLEGVLLDVLAGLGIAGARVPGRVGIWIGDARKIAAIGVRISRWVTSHGFALNVTDEALPPFSWIVPCGIRDRGVTSVAAELGRDLGLDDLRPLVETAFRARFQRPSL